MNGNARRVGAKRESILEAASEVFCEDGYDVASMDRVAERAGASKRTVYNHFGSKEALFEAVMGRLLEKKHASKQVAWDPARPLSDQLTDFARAKASFAEDEGSMALVRVALATTIRQPGMLLRFMARYADQEDELVTWLREASQAGAMDVPDPELAAELFWATAGGALFWPAALGIQGEPEARERITAELVAMFLARYEAVS